MIVSRLHGHWIPQLCVQDLGFHVFFCSQNEHTCNIWQYLSVLNVIGLSKLKDIKGIYISQV